MRLGSEFVSIAFATLLSAAGPVSAQTLGSPAPNFTLKTLAGDTVSLSDYPRRPLLLNFWASWCKPCRGEMSDIIAAYNAHHAAGLEVLAINLTDQERPARSRARQSSRDSPKSFRRGRAPQLTARGGSMRVLPMAALTIGVGLLALPRQSFAQG